MSQGTDSTIKLPPELVPYYAPVRAELDRSEELLRDSLVSDHPFVDELVRHGFRLGGKRLRSVLVLLSGLATGELQADHPKLAATVEMIHTATLVHDDVLDEADTRRHLATVNARWSNEASVLTGDYLLSQALCMAGETDDMFAIREIAETCRVMCEGELRQVASRGNYDLTEPEYFNIIEQKTAMLLACSCRLGAHYADADLVLVQSLGQYGMHLGVAFQIADDLLDLLGDEQQVGKSLGTDLIKEKLTLPIIRLIGQCPESQRAELIDRLIQFGDQLPDSNDEVEGHEDETFPTANSFEQRRAMIHEILDDTDAIDYARSAAHRHVETSVQLLREHLPDSAARDALEGIARFVVCRNS